MRKMKLSAVLLSIAVCGCSSEPVRTVSSHPPASSFQCAAEPAALTDEQIMADQFGQLERQFTVDAIIAGRSCRDALRRVCQWHKDRGMKEPANCATPSPAQPSTSLRENASPAERGSPSA